MREIKFRAWDKIDKKMIDVSDFVLPKKSETDSFILMQFTGLFDKLGKEIYEGDLIEFILVDKKEIGEVSFDEDTCGFYIKHKEGYRGFFGIYKNIIEVCKYKIIGNIHENPELLNN